MNILFSHMMSCLGAYNVLLCDFDMSMPRIAVLSDYAPGNWSTDKSLSHPVIVSVPDVCKNSEALMMCVPLTKLGDLIR